MSVCTRTDSPNECHHIWFESDFSVGIAANVETIERLTAPHHWQPLNAFTGWRSIEQSPMTAAQKKKKQIYAPNSVFFHCFRYISVVNCKYLWNSKNSLVLFPNSMLPCVVLLQDEWTCWVNMSKQQINIQHKYDRVIALIDMDCECETHSNQELHFNYFFTRACRLLLSGGGKTGFEAERKADCRRPIQRMAWWRVKIKTSFVLDPEIHIQFPPG